MKFKNILICLFCGAGIALLACNNAADQQEPLHVYADYYVRYLAATQQLKAEVQFTEGAELQNAQSKIIAEGVRFLDKEMDLQLLKKSQHRYSYTDTMSFSPSVYFQNGNDKSLHREELTMLPIELYSVRDNASKETGLTLITNDNLLKGNENLTILLSDEENRAASFTVHGPVSDTIHQIPPGAFQSLRVGPGSLYLVKRMKKTRSGANQTITATFEYYTDTLAVVIQD